MKYIPYVSAITFAFGIFNIGMLSPFTWIAFAGIASMFWLLWKISQAKSIYDERMNRPVQWKPEHKYPKK